jgi:hypothetical protein
MSAAVALTLLSGPVPARADPVRIQLQDATPADAGRELQRVLGAPVEVRGGNGKRVTLNLPAVAPGRALDQVAAQLGGSWRMKLLVKSGRPEIPRPSPPLDRSMALGVQDLAASKAFALVARELRAELELEGEVDTRVALIAVNVSVGVILDRLAEQAGATWDVSYLIEAPDAPVAIPVRPRAKDPSEVPLIPVPSVPLVPAPPAPTLAAPAAELRAALWEGIRRIARAEPARRSESIREFLQQGAALQQALALLPPSDRADRLRALSTVLPPWRKLYQGLAPNVRAELAPVTALLEGIFTTKAPGH